MFNFFKKKPADNSPLNKIDSLGILTSNRPKSLFNCLSGAIENLKKHEHLHTKIYICDDSNNDASKKLLVEQKNKLNWNDLLYFGQAEKQQYLSKLHAIAKDSDVKPSTLEFAFANPFNFKRTTGANRNWQLLLSVGEQIISCDDDTVFNFSLGKQFTSNDIKVTSLDDSSTFTCFKNHKELEAVAQWQDVDFFTEHAKLLGQSIADIRRSQLKIDHQHLSPYLDSLLSNKKGKVLNSMLGMAGDSGMGFPRYLLTLEGLSRDNLFPENQSQLEFQQRCLSRVVLRKNDSAVISDSLFFMMPQAGLDNRTLLPPFMPIERNQDGIFALSLRTCFKESLSAYLPAAIKHSPPEARHFKLPELTAPPYAFSSILSACIQMVGDSLWGSDTENLIELGHNIESNVSKLSSSQFCLEIGEYMIQKQMLYSQYLQQLLEKYQDESPDYWSTAIKQSIVGIETLTEQFALGKIAPASFLEQYADDSYEVIQNITIEYGRLLQAWPSIMEMALELKSASAHTN